MVLDIVVVILCLIVLAAGIWGWLIESGYDFKKSKSNNMREKEEKVEEINERTV